MADKMCENNQVTIMGEIVSDFSYSHEVYGEGFYMVEVSVHRLSSFVDYIPVMVSERLVNVQESAEGKCVYITGQFRSFNRHEEHKNRLVLSVFAREFELVEQFEEENAANQIFLDGFICKESVYRKTPLGQGYGSICHTGSIFITHIAAYTADTFKMIHLFKCVIGTVKHNFLAIVILFSCFL